MSTRSRLERMLARPISPAVGNSTVGLMASVNARWLTHRGRPLVLSAALLAGASRLEAQTAITWNFTTGTAAAAGSVANISASAVSAGNTASSSALVVNTTSASDFSGASGTYNLGVRTATSATLSTATSTYFEFTLTPTTGYSITATSFSFGTRSAGTGPTALALYSSVDNFLANLSSTTVSANATWTSVVLSGFNVSGAQGGAVTFRLYGAPAGTAGTPNWRIDDLSMTATASAIPEPSTYAAVGGVFALAGAVVWRRRGRSKAG